MSEPFWYFKFIVSITKVYGSLNVRHFIQNFVSAKFHTMKNTSLVVLTGLKFQIFTQDVLETYLVVYVCFADKQDSLDNTCVHNHTWIGYRTLTSVWPVTKEASVQSNLRQKQKFVEEWLGTKDDDG